MDKDILRVFQIELIKQCRFALIADQDLKHALSARDNDRIWYSVQSFLGATGNISKLLWPPSPQIPERADELKKSLSINDDSPLAPRRFRNHFEHFDERLERWATSSKRLNFIDSNVGPVDFISGVDLDDYLRNFDTSNYAVTFRGDTYQLQPIIDAIQELYQKVTE